MVFLVFLWTGSGSDNGGSDAITLWRWIMLNDLAAQATTIASVILQAAIGLQATVCRALAAAVLLDSKAVRMSDIPLFSILRAVNGGPSSIAELLIWTPRKLFGTAPAWLTLTLSLSTISSEFTSTLLLLDFRKASLLDKSITNAMAVIETQPELLLPPANGTTDKTRSWRSAPSTYPPLGEIILRASQPQNRTKRHGNNQTRISAIQCTRKEAIEEIQWNSSDVHIRGSVWPTSHKRVNVIYPRATQELLAEDQ